MPLFNQLAGVFLIEAKGLALALSVRPMRAALLGAFVGFQTAPSEAVDNIFLCTGYIPALIRIFNAEDEIAPVAPGEQIVIKDRPDTPKVQSTGGAWRKSYSDFFAHRAQRYIV
jgi:hypothetical protein